LGNDLSLDSGDADIATEISVFALRPQVYFANRRTLKEIGSPTTTARPAFLHGVV
jgi:hypothetical protein